MIVLWIFAALTSAWPYLLSWDSSSSLLTVDSTTSSSSAPSDSSGNVSHHNSGSSDHDKKLGEFLNQILIFGFGLAYVYALSSFKNETSSHLSNT